MLWAPWRTAATPRITRTTITTSGPAALTINGVDRDLALSPDGTHVVYVGNSGRQLFVRALDALEPMALASGSVRGPFVSPDGQWVAFFDGSTLRKVGITGGRRSLRQPRRGLQRRDLGPRRRDHLRDGQLDDGAAARIGRGWDAGDAHAARPRAGAKPPSLAGDLARRPCRPLHNHVADGRARDGPGSGARSARDTKVLLRGRSHGHYVASGLGAHSWSTSRRGRLCAIPFDRTRFETHGTAVPVLPRLRNRERRADDFAVAADGTLV